MPRPGYERVASFATAAEAEVVRGLLEASGIDAHLAGTNHLVREHIPSGEVAVLVPALDVARARAVVESARVPDEPGAEPRPPRPFSVPWKAQLALGGVLLAAGVLLLAAGAGGVARACLLGGAALVAVGALNGLGERRERARPGG